MYSSSARERLGIATSDIIVLFATSLPSKGAAVAVPTLLAKFKAGTAVKFVAPADTEGNCRRTFSVIEFQ